MDSSPPNTGFISVPHSDAVLIYQDFSLSSNVYCILAIFDGADDSGVHNR